MNDEEKQAEIDKLVGDLEEAKVGKAGMPEAGRIAFTTFYSRAGVAYNVTARGATAWEALQEIVRTAKLAALALDMWTVKPEPPAAKPPTVPADQRIAKEEGNKELAAELKQAAEDVGESKTGKPWHVIDATTVEIAPKPDNRVDVLFFADGHKYADARVNNWKLEAASGLLKYVTSEPVDKPARLTLRCKAYATEGKEYTKKDGTMGHYLDIEHVRPA